MRAPPERSLGHRLGAVDSLKRQDGGLQVGREEEKIQQLRDPRLREPQRARHGGPIRHQSPVYRPLEAVRQGEHTSHVCQPGGGPKRDERNLEEDLATMLALSPPTKAAVRPLQQGAMRSLGHIRGRSE